MVALLRDSSAHPPYTIPTLEQVTTDYSVCVCVCVCVGGWVGVGVHARD